MSERPEIALGDLIRVVAALAPADRAVARRLARILQIGGEDAESAGDDIESVHAMPGPARADSRLEVELQQPAAAVSPHDQIPPVMRATDDEHIWMPEPRRRSAVPAYDAAPNLPAPTPQTNAQQPALLASALSLFQPRWTRSLLAAALATEKSEGDVDIDRLIDMLARRIALRDLPRHPRWTLRLGAHVLVERGIAMLPFRRDVAQLLARIDGIGGDVVTLSFRSDPTRVYRQSPQTVVNHKAPPGTLMLAIGNLGLVDQAVGTAGRWLDWAQRLDRQGCPVVVITPVAPCDWPAALARTATIISWDRMTTSSSVHRARATRRPR